ncbi:hypothetical protein Poli38472_006182 [Pythium oligandrum]|uniref:Kinesin-like protein n=1 Tax=Pythium oligandrum TaxID=41045 RepID=A0A8K1FPU2_PYTOL|nr:hypothetical protein Poli38472_006182 [Pythium oligandrum]|eukprot:TMW68714.1 hypothetical protein Poli38472_006182 [Pythium oligandrum]
MLIADAVFQKDSSQSDVFHSVEDCIDGLLAGYDCSVFAYGQTGTGKTYTMSGLPPNKEMSVESDEDFIELIQRQSFGIVPRCIQKLFDQIDKARTEEGSGVTFTVYCSFVEIYNEKIYDILSANLVALSPSSKRQRDVRNLDHRAGWNRPQPTKETPSLPIRQKLDGSVFIDGLTSRKISTRAEMLQAFCEGSMNREVRDNLYNQHSSRGHSIFQITLRKNIESEHGTKSSPRRERNEASNAGAAPKSRLSRLFFVDLAGSEKWHVNGSELSDKYASELASINKSLSALTNCVLALTQKERAHVPFRDSVLTRLLQSCLQGVGRTAFIVTVSPAKDSLEESFATLRFAERLKTLRCRPIRKKVFSNELMGEQRMYYERQIQNMRLEVARLRELLKKAQRRNQEITENTATVANLALTEENRRLKELLMHSERNRLSKRDEERVGRSSLHAATVSPQQMTGKQIVSPRPFSEDESSKSASLDDSSDGIGGSSTPQPRTSRRADVVDVESGKAATGGDQQQYSTLVNQLQDQEARLNWMLEAEMEAQNTRTRSQTVIEGEEAKQTSVTSPTRKPTITRSWAVERALQRNLPTIPQPVRNPHGDGKDKTPVPSESNAALIRQRYMINEEAAELRRRKEDVVRDPARTTDKSRISSHASSDLAAASVSQSQTKHTPPTRPIAPSRPARGIEGHTNSPKTTDQAKSSSILKLFGTGTPDQLGKSKDELVDQYKRARRAELEAMLRTMVHR